MEKWLELEYKAALPTFKAYRALSLHFGKGNYDYFKYNGNVKADLSTIISAKGNMQYIKLHKMITDCNMLPADFIAANFLKNGVKWVGALTNVNAKNIALEFMAIQQNMGQHIISQLRKEFIDRCIDDGLKFRDAFTTDDPMCLPLIIAGYVEHEFDFNALVGLVNCFGLKAKYDKELAGNFIWEDISAQLERQLPFYRYNQREVQNQLATFLKEYW